MPYSVMQSQLPQGNGQADTTNLGYQFPGMGGSSNAMTAGFNWNSAQPQQAAGANPFASQGAGGVGNDAYSLQHLIEQQQQQNNSARQQNQANWDSAKNNLLGIPGQYSGQQSTTDAQGLTHQLAANPLSLSPTIVQQMKNQASNNITAQSDNLARQMKGSLAAGGQDDAGSIAAMQAQLGRQNMAQQVNSNTNIDIDAAKQRTTDLQNAAKLSQGQSAQDIGVPLGVGNSIISHLPQVKPDDLSGLIAMTNSNNFQNALLSQQANQFNPLHTPTAFNPIGGKYSQSNNQLPGFGNGSFAPDSATQDGGAGGNGGQTPTNSGNAGNLGWGDKSWNTQLPGTNGPNNVGNMWASGKNNDNENDVPLRPMS